MNVQRLKQQIARTVNELGDSFNLDDAVKMDDMSEFVLSPYDEPIGQQHATATISDSKNSTPIKINSKKSIDDDDEIIDSIDAAYFIDNNEFNAISYELKKLPDIDSCAEDMSREMMRLKSQHSGVSKRLSQLIMQRSPSYNSQMLEMENIRADLAQVISHVATIRESLATAKSRARNSLGLIANVSKRENLKSLKTHLLAIKMFHEAEHQLMDILEDGNIPLAIQLLIETQIMAGNYSEYKCVKDIMQKLLGMHKLLDDKLDETLSAIALSYDHDKYRNVCTAFEMLDRLDKISEKVIESFQNGIEAASRTIIVDKITGPIDEKMQYSILCSKVNNEDVVIALRELCFVICQSFYSLHRILRYQFDCANNIYQDLLESRRKIYVTAMNHIIYLIEARDFSMLKFDHVLEIIDMINRVKSIGSTYFHQKSLELTTILEARVSSYFKFYHKERLDELSMFIENESFTLCPVPYQFTIFDLYDFECLKDVDEVPERDGLADEICLMPLEWQNPFSQSQIRSRHQSSYQDEPKSRTFSANESIDSTFDEPTRSSDGPASPNLCNTTLNLLRTFGKYLRITALLPAISVQTAPGIIQLYEFLFLSFCHLFGKEVDLKLENSFETISKRLSGTSDKITSPVKKVLRSFKADNVYPSLCPAVQLGFVDDLFGAAERIVAIESIEFTAKQLDLMRPVIESFLEDAAIQTQLEIFYTNMVPCCIEAKKLIIDTSVTRAFRLKTLIEMIIAINWDINELRSQHNTYVEFLLQDFDAFALRLAAIREKAFLSEPLRKLFWDRALFYCFKSLVQGYGDIGKCSTEGRALMQLDFQTIVIKIESLSGYKPLPHAGFVDDYIKAFYLSEKGLEQWIKTHSEYSSKQIVSLLGAAAHVSKKARSRIMEALND